MIDRAALHHFSEDAEDVRLVGGIHREVGLLPIAEDAEAAERFPLDIDEAGGELGAAAADFGRFKACGLLHDLELDRQSVAVPAGDEGGVEAGHGLRFHDHVF